METRCNDPDCTFPKCSCWETKRRFSQSRLVRLEKALEFLIEVKEHKDKYGKDEWYNDAQPMAWEQARTALKI